MLEPRILTVAQINRYIKSLFEKDLILQSLWVKGEISNFKHHSSGHLYFTLKDAEGTINAVMFKGDARILPFVPENGMKVVICGYISLYEKTGQYQLYAQLMQPDGIGALALAFNQLKEKLEKEGIFDKDFKREIPQKPKTVAIITSPTGAAVRDIINIAKRRNAGVRLIVVPVLVQGENAPESIINALKLVNKWGEADTIILGRGGGSIEDLWAFNSEGVARAIFSSEIPVISAVGHETDFTIADFVADLRAPTPSAAAELAINDILADLDKLKALKIRLYFAEERLLEKQKNRLEISSRTFKRPEQILVNNQMFLASLKDSIEKNTLLILEKNTQKFNTLVDKLAILSPLNTLKRGYSITFKENTVVNSVDNIKENDRIKIRLADGICYAVAERCEKE